MVSSSTELINGNPNSDGLLNSPQNHDGVTSLLMPKNTPSIAASRSEREAQVELVDFLTGSLANQKAFFAAFPEKIGNHFGDLREILKVTDNVPTSAGGFIDVLMESDTHALVIELKIDHRENPFQYTHYRKFLMQRGFDTLAVGIISNAEPLRGRTRLNEAILSIVADARISWGELLARLQEQSAVAMEVHRFTEYLERIYPEVTECRRVIISKMPANKNMAFLENSPETLATFMQDIMARLPLTMIAIPDQRGSSPPLLCLGKPEWAEYFEDEDFTRVILNFDIPRKSKPIDQLYLHFCVGIYNKTFSGSKRPANPEKLVRLAQYLARKDYDVMRNTPGKPSPGVTWSEPYLVGRTGFFWANAFDDVHYRRSLFEAKNQGWDTTIEEIILNVERIAGDIESMINGK